MVAMVGIFTTDLAAPSVALLAALALGVGGLAPGAIYSAAPRVAPTPEALPTTIGLFQQASNLGQFAGPVTIGFVIERLGWHQVPVAFVPVGLAGLAIALAVRIYFRFGRTSAVWNRAAPRARADTPIAAAVSDSR
jgi:predicted MFS family arabinose efflux permease